MLFLKMLSCHNGRYRIDDHVWKTHLILGMDTINTPSNCDGFSNVGITIVIATLVRIRRIPDECYGAIIQVIY